MTVVWRSRFKKVANPGDRTLGSNGLTPPERTVSDAVKNATRGLTSPQAIDAAQIAAQSGSIERVVAAFDWGVFGQALSVAQDGLTAQIIQTGKSEAKKLSEAGFKYSFEMTDPRAVAWSSTRGGQLVVEISETVRAEIRQSVTRAITEGLTRRELSAVLERQVGLFSRWANAVENSYGKNLRDFQKQGLSFSQAESKAMKLANEYRDRLIAARAKNIARTEIMRASNTGRFISWQQAGDRRLIDLSKSSKRWQAVGGACDICGPADDETVPVDDLFSTGELMPPAHPSCRCTAVLLPEPIDVADYLTPEELAFSE
jgi:hypothetical protein